MSVLRPITWHANSTLTGSAVIQAVLSDLNTERRSDLAAYLRENQPDLTRYADRQIPIALEAQRQQQVTMAGEEEDVIEKPILLAEMPTSYSGVIPALQSLIANLVDEGPPVAAADSDKGGKRRRNSGTARIRPKYKRNPFLPEDQDPLSLFLARTQNPRNVPVQPYECRRAARLLLPHTVGEKPDFSRSQVMGLIRLIEQEMERREDAFTPTGPKETQPSPEDYRIVLPNAGSYPWMHNGTSEGLVSWSWSGAPTFKLFMPANKTFGGVDVFRLVKTLEAEGQYCTVRVLARGQYSEYEITSGIDAVKTWAELLRGESQDEFAARLEAAELLWRIVQPMSAQVRRTPDALTAEEVKQLEDFYAKAGNRGLSDEMYRGLYDSPWVKAVYQILHAIPAQTAVVTGYPHGTPADLAEARPGEVTLVLPPNVMPFRIQQMETSWRIWVGTGTNVNAPYWFTKEKSHPPVEGLKYSAASFKWPKFERRNIWSKDLEADKAFSASTQDVKETVLPNFESNITNWFQLDPLVSKRFSLIHIAAALRAAALGQTLTNAEESANANLDLELIYALSQGSDAPGVRLGAGRIHPVQVTSPDTGRTMTVEGVSPEVREKIKYLVPGTHFKGVKLVFEAGAGVGNKGKASKKVFRPLPYQQVGIAFIHATGCRAMIADEMGLGKTIQAIGALAVDPSPVTGKRMLPALVICPSSVVVNWINEIKTWLPQASVGAWVKGKQQNFDVTVLSWTMAGRNYAEHLGHYQTVILDEAHYGKRLYKTSNSAARPTLSQILSGKLPAGSNSQYVLRTFGAVAISQSAPHAILLTGTPLENGDKDLDKLWTYCYILNPVVYSNQKEFISQIFGQEQKRGERRRVVLEAEVPPGMDKPAWLERVHKLLGRYMIRRTKSTVTEQIKLGCMYVPGYNHSDAGCVGSTTEIVTGVQEGDTDILMNSRRRSNRSRGYAYTAKVQARRNAALQDLGGFMRLGVTKTIEYRYIALNPAQVKLIEAVNENLLGVIAEAEKRRKIKDVAAKLYDDNDFSFDTIQRYVALVNAAHAEKDAADIQDVVLAVYHYLRSTVGLVKIQATLDFIHQTIVVEKEPLLVWFDQLSIVRAVSNAIEGKTEFRDPDTGELVKMDFQPLLVRGKPVQYAVVTGESSPEQKAEAVRRFQSGEIDLLLCSKALREGVTLTRAAKALFVEFWWVPAWLMQAEDRIYRIGQTRDTQITYLVCPRLPNSKEGLTVDSMDDKMMTMLQRKRKAAETVLGGDSFQTGSEVEEGEEEDEIDTEEEEVAATKKGISEALSGLAEILARAGSDMFITENDVITELQSNLPEVEVYELTKKGQNANYVEEGYKLLSPSREWEARAYKSGLTYKIDHERLLQFVNRQDNRTLYYQDLSALANTDDPRAVNLRSEFHKEPQMSEKDVMKYMGMLNGLADGKRKQPGILQFIGDTSVLRYGETEERTILRFMQNRAQWRIENAKKNPYRFEAPDLLKALKANQIVPPTFTLKKLAEVMASLETGEVSGKKGDQRRLVFRKTEKVRLQSNPSSGNTRINAIRKAMPMLVQRDQIAAIPETTKALLAALPHPEGQQAANLYVELRDAVTLAEKTGFTVPKAARAALSKAYAELSRG